jgi:AbiV family abortive infection protein
VLNLGRARPQLSVKQRFELGGASVANATDLRKDAQLLLDQGRFQRAAFLLYACMEELLKAHLCLRGEPTDWNKFWGTFRDHERKLALLSEIDPGSRGETKEVKRLLTHWRERCLYVEASHPGDPLTPRGLVDPGGLNAGTIASFSLWVDERILQFIALLAELEPSMRGKGSAGP